jgi:hypothetical protein
MSVLAAAQAQLPLVKGDDGEIMTQQFLSVCKLVFPVIGERGGITASVFFSRFVVSSSSSSRRSLAFSLSHRSRPPKFTQQTSSARPLGSSRWTSEATST